MPQTILTTDASANFGLRAATKTAVTNMLLKLVEDKDPVFSNPVGKGAGIFLAIQFFTHKTFQNSLFKKINKFK